MYLRMYPRLCMFPMCIQKKNSDMINVRSTSVRKFRAILVIYISMYKINRPIKQSLSRDGRHLVVYLSIMIEVRNRRRLLY